MSVLGTVQLYGLALEKKSLGLMLASVLHQLAPAKVQARVSPGVFVVSPGVLENTWSSSLGIARRRSARPPQAAPSPRTTLFLIRAATAAFKVVATMLVD